MTFTGGGVTKKKKKKESINWGEKSRYKSKNTISQTFIFTLIKIICMQTENNLFV